jgi:hypothetical protein
MSIKLSNSTPPQDIDELKAMSEALSYGTNNSFEGHNKSHEDDSIA